MTTKIKITKILSNISIICLGLITIVSSFNIITSATIDENQTSTTKICGSGFTLNGDKCSYMAKYTCSQGSLVDTNCVADGNRQVTYSCNGTDTLNDTSCTANGKNYPAIPNGTIAGDCPSGYTILNNNQCSKNAIYQPDPVVPIFSSTTVVISSISSTPVITSSPVVSSATPPTQIPSEPIFKQPPSPQNFEKPPVSPIINKPIFETENTSRSSLISVPTSNINLNTISSVTISSISKKITNTEEITLKNINNDILATINPDTTIKNNKNEELPVSKLNFYETQTIPQDSNSQTKTKIFGFGQENDSLVFSKPIKIVANLDTTFLNQNLSVKVKHFGETEFGTTGLSTNPNMICSSTELNNNKIKNLSLSQITFYTCGASIFSITIDNDNKEDVQANIQKTDETNSNSSVNTTGSKTAQTNNSSSNNIPTGFLKNINIIFAIIVLSIFILIIFAAFLYKNIRQTNKKKIEDNYHTNNINKLPKIVTPNNINLNKLPTILPITLPISNLKTSNLSNTNNPSKQIDDQKIDQKIDSNIAKLTDYDKAMVAEEIETLEDDFTVAQLPPIPPTPLFPVFEYDNNKLIEQNDSVIPALQSNMKFEDLIGNINNNIQNQTHSIPHFSVDPNDQILIVTGQTLQNNPVVETTKSNKPLHLKTDPTHQLSLNDKYSKKRKTRK